MKIVIPDSKMKLVPYYEIRAGECFQLDNKIYIKTSSCQNCVCLENGCVDSFPSGLVFRVDAEVVVKGYL